MTIKYLLVIKIIFFILIAIALVSSFKLLFILLLIQILGRRFYKVRFPTPEMELRFQKQQIFAPVHGIVREIIAQPKSYFLKIHVGLFNHKGIYSLNSGEIDSVESYEHAQKTFASRSLKKLLARPKYKIMQISFMSKHESSYSMSVINTTLSLKPSTFIMPGDRIRYGAHLGWLPLGGVLVLELPNNGKLMVKIGDRIKMFHTQLMEMN